MHSLYPPPATHTHSYTQSASFFSDSKLKEEIAFRMKRKYIYFHSEQWILSECVFVFEQRPPSLISNCNSATCFYGWMIIFSFCGEDQKKKKKMEGGGKYEIQKSMARNSCSSRIVWSPSAVFGVLGLERTLFSPSLSLKEVVILVKVGAINDFFLGTCHNNSMCMWTRPGIHHICQNGHSLQYVTARGSKICVDVILGIEMVQRWTNYKLIT